MEKVLQVATDVNADPITGAPGSHPVATGVGAGGGAVAGAAVGAVAGGPVGAAIGGVVGAVAGAAAGHGVGEAMNPTAENEYWEKTYRSRRYVAAGQSFAHYQDAYRYGYESRAAMLDKKWDDVEADLAKGWEAGKGKSVLLWEQAKNASKDAWFRVGRPFSGDGARA